MRKLHKVPFYSQRSQDDWQERGFENIEEAVFWQGKSCGIACMKMVLDMHTDYAGKKFSDLIKEMDEKGVYKAGVGCVHQGIASDLNSKGIDSQRMKIENLDDFRKFIDQDNIFIASIGPGFIEGRKSGHLVPVVGYKEEGGKITHLIIHHTSSSEKWQWPEREIDASTFIDHFSGNTIRVRLYYNFITS
jgi:hypothetical protein